MFKNGMRPIHPGEYLREEYLKPLGMSESALAEALHVPVSLIADLAMERAHLSAEMALRLARYFGGDARTWMSLQVVFDLREEEPKSAAAIEAGIAPMTEAGRDRGSTCE